uniref:C-type lectin domain-containing protein n=1 Tax=Daphnia galeata TaxID=27404 RepID=A0A8J2RGJ7_9CRUS|nr:unnamed protein product [Daphnia galeata]
MCSLSKKKEIEFTKEIEALNTKVEKLMQKMQKQDKQLIERCKNNKKVAILSSTEKIDFSREIETLNNKIEMCNKDMVTLRQSSEKIAEENQKLKTSLTDCKNREECQTLSVGNLEETIGTPELKLGNNENPHLSVNCKIPVSVEDSVIINATSVANSNCKWDWQFKTSEDRILVFSLIPNQDHSFTKEELYSFFTIQDGLDGQTIRFEKPKLNNVTSKILPEVAYTSHSTARVRFNNPSMRPLALIPQLKVQKALVCPSDLGDKTSQCGRLDDEVSCYCATFTKGYQPSQLKYCKNHQMKLLSIETKEKQKAIFSVWDKKYIFMTSGKRTTLDNGVNLWNWNSTGEKITYTNWLPGEPNNGIDHDACIAAHSSGWIDTRCSGPKASIFEAICEAHP